MVLYDRKFFTVLLLNLERMAHGQEKRKADLKLVILGDSSVGKTTLIHRYMEGIFTNKTSTIGASFILKQWGPYNVAIWDTAGEEKYAGLSSFYCRGASAAILAVDLTRHNSLNVLKDRHIPLLQSAEEDCLCVVVGTKLDLVNDTTRQISTDIGKALAKTQNKERLDKLNVVPYFETSSKTGKNVENVFDFILNTCLPLDGDCEEKGGRTMSSGDCVDLNAPKHCHQKRKCC
ncbi:ras-related protein Rab-20-like isoform X2 [Dendronephthya gigantea]|uniref:ras-related protein Rab-20-like isoform X2 n=1 Tax=Dendronephthya gigantea TaxID=151771 RepID=UPI00106A605A|nr:ras-related protein Rab-20-like isoform X2 [Dendronephthya gigantea]